MKNVLFELKDNTLTIKVDVTKTYGPSKSGKTTIIASTEGNVHVSDTVVLGLNVYKPLR